jgi:RNA recognition motif-containing protein
MYGKSRGFAIVNFNNIVDAERAISIVNGIDISGRVIEVTFKFLCSATNILSIFYYFIEYIHKNCV